MSHASLAPPPPTVNDLIFPDSDGLPMAENTLQFEWIVTIKCGLEAVFKDDPEVFVAGDLFWYPDETDPTTRVAPDTMVVFGRPKGYRGSYQQWKEEGIAPQVVFEVLSPSNTVAEMLQKGNFYSRHGVQEYYVYDPLQLALFGYERVENALREIPLMSGWVSPLLQVRFRMGEEGLELYGPDGTRFPTYLELKEQRDMALSQRDEAFDQRDEALERNERLTQRLRELGIDPESV